LSAAACIGVAFVGFAADPSFGIGLPLETAGGTSKFRFQTLCAHPQTLAAPLQDSNSTQLNSTLLLNGPEAQARTKKKKKNHKKT